MKNRANEIKVTMEGKEAERYVAFVVSDTGLNATVSGSIRDMILSYLALGNKIKEAASEIGMSKEEIISKTLEFEKAKYRETNPTKGTEEDLTDEQKQVLEGLKNVLDLLTGLAK